MKCGVIDGLHDSPYRLDVLPEPPPVMVKVKPGFNPWLLAVLVMGFAFGCAVLILIL